MSISFRALCAFACAILVSGAAAAQEPSSTVVREFPLDKPFSMEALPDPQVFLKDVRGLLEEAKTGSRALSGNSFIGVGRAGENAHGTWGFLFVEENGQLVHKGYTLEPRASVGKGPIPQGTYSYKKWDSPSLKKTLRLHNVPGFTDILVHVGNTQSDTKGCILVGRSVDDTAAPTRLIDSRSLVDYLYDNYSAGNIAVVSQ